MKMDLSSRKNVTHSYFIKHKTIKMVFWTLTSTFCSSFIWLWYYSSNRYFIAIKTEEKMFGVIFLMINLLQPLRFFISQTRISAKL